MNAGGAKAAALAFLLAAPAVAAGHASVARAAAQLLSVAQKGRAFAVAELEAPAGATIRFTNDDDFPHQISIKGAGLELESGLQAPGELLEVPLPASGTFEVRCGIHPKMRMRLLVR